MLLPYLHIIKRPRFRLKATSKDKTTASKYALLYKKFLSIQKIANVNIRITHRLSIAYFIYTSVLQIFDFDKFPNNLKFSKSRTLYFTFCTTIRLKFVLRLEVLM